ncbi:Fe-S oxidoreductase [Candidatus Scalindua japonica]|uniref:Fe-S oxidoreductase n=1 Tax=Candidatus Scalindua japonica TaxID=1284222 RepID=A0A286TWZ7_9BACT|nr:radical SAM protein [Candidatus Scalindua japonica]GAX60417.1 Fe-S oxidoreductase [Candidatus Scalindua japonica]
MKILFPMERNSMKQHWLGIMTLSAVLKKGGFQTEVVVAEEEIVLEKIKNNEPTILAYSTPTFLAKFNIEFNLKIKKRFKDVFSIFGGPHATYYPEMIENEGIDAICVGEGEGAIHDLATNIANGLPVTDIKNLWVKENGKIRKNPLRPLVENLDNLPYPDRDIFIPYQSKNPLASIWTMSARGCPYKCTYCFNHSYNKLYQEQGYSAVKVRRRSVDNFIGELIEYKKRWPATYFIFVDDIFVLMPEWIKEFSEKYKKLVDIPFVCHVRANAVNNEVISEIKKAGCTLIKMGVEAGNDHIRKEVLKRNMSKDLIVNAAKIIKDNGIKLFTFNVLGVPSSTIDNDFETLALNAKCKADYATTFIMRAYKKTEIYEFSRKKNLLHEEFIEDIADTQNIFFSSPITLNPKDARLLENLLYLFSISVKFPWIVPLVRRLLIKLPLSKVYQLIFTNHYRFIKLLYSPKKFERIYLYLDSVIKI